jgi:hypothetical protein
VTLSTSTIAYPTTNYNSGRSLDGRDEAGAGAGAGTGAAGSGDGQGVIASAKAKYEQCSSNECKAGVSGKSYFSGFCSGSPGRTARADGF